MHDHIRHHAIAEQVRALRSHETTARDLAAGVRRDVEQAEQRIHAWVALAPDIETQADAVDAEPACLPLAGISVGVKDIIDVAGLPTRAGTVLSSPEPAASDAACVSALRSLGAVIQGKTVTTEFAYLNPGPTRNPHSQDHTPGGSSSGSAAAVGAGTIPVALGSQTAGSLTRPAAYCGTAGMVLPPGSVDMSGILGLSPSLDALGLLTRTVADLHYVHRAFTTCASDPERPRSNGVRLWDGRELADIAPAMSGLVGAVPGILDGIGFESRPLEWADDVRRLTDGHLDVMSYEALRERAHEYRAHSAQLSEPLLELLRAGEEVSAQRYASVLRYRDDARARLSDHLGPDTLIVGPATPGPAPAGLHATGVSVLSRAWQLLGLPVVVVPGAQTPSGLPLGLQIIGLPGSESAMLDLGIQLEQALRSRQLFR